MKNILLLAFALSFVMNNNLLASNNTLDTSVAIRKNKLCKTWYVAQAYSVNKNNNRKDKTDKAQGSIFVFNKDYSFSLTDMSRKNIKTVLGTWEETGKDSISITMEKITLQFGIIKLTRDSLAIMANDERSSGRKLNIVFSSSFIKPIDRKELIYKDLNRYEEIETETAVSVEEMEVMAEEEIEADISEEIIEPEINAKKKSEELASVIAKKWVIDKVELVVPGITQDLTKYYQATTFSFNTDQSVTFTEVVEGVSKTSFGTWKLSKINKIEMRIEDNLRTFVILESSNNIFIIKDENEKNYYKYYLISE